jgi:hypothetical protein
MTVSDRSESKMNKCLYQDLSGLRNMLIYIEASTPSFNPLVGRVKPISVLRVEDWQSWNRGSLYRYMVEST